MPLLKIHVAMLPQEPEVRDKVEVCRTEFKLRETRHLSEIAPAVAPVKSNGGNGSPRAGRLAFPLIVRQIVERKRTKTFPLHNDFCGFALSRLHGRRIRHP